MNNSHKLLANAVDVLSFLCISGVELLVCWFSVAVLLSKMIEYLSHILSRILCPEVSTVVYSQY